MRQGMMLLVIFVLFSALSLFAAPPRIMNYQAKLTDASGVALDGDYSIDFRIYAVETGGSYIWHQTKTVTVTNGLFDVQLNLGLTSDTPDTNRGDTLKFDRPYWIALEVGSDGEMTPREKLTPVSFAYRSIYADTADYTAGGGGSGVPSQAYVAFPDSSARAEWTYTGCYEVKECGDSWTTKASMPTARYSLGAAAVNGKIYAIGGYNGSSYFSTNEEYDPTTDSWTTKANMPTARSGSAGAAVYGKIYVIGGYDGSDELSTNEEYDPSTDTWTTKANMPTARSSLTGAAVYGKIYAIGGGGAASGSGHLPTNEEYDPSTDTWTTKADMPTGRHDLAAAAVNGRIYVIGGWGSSMDENEEYTPEDDGDMVWENNPKIPKILFLSAYPNPFNSSLSISYFVPEQSKVSLTICDVLGARLATLVNEPQPAGAHTVIWNAPKDAHSGIYFVRMNAGENVFVKRALLIK